MSGINKVILIGRLGSDVELSHTPNGRACCSLSLATTETYKDKAGTKKEATEWHKLVFWNKLAELANEYLRKGSQIFVEGSLKTRSWEKDGVKKYATEVIVSNLQFLDSKKDSNNGNSDPGGY